MDGKCQNEVTLASVTQQNGALVKPGDSIPGITPQNLKFGAEVAVLDNLWMGADVISVSGSYLRGDEANQQPKVGGYTVLSLNVRYLPVKFLEIWGRVDNVTNANYATAAPPNSTPSANPLPAPPFSPPPP